MLQNLDGENISMVREVFARQRHMRFMKSFSDHLPFGTKDAYVREIMAADLDRLAHLIRVCGFLVNQLESSLAKSLDDLAPRQRR